MSKVKIGSHDFFKLILEREPLLLRPSSRYYWRHNAEQITTALPFNGEPEVTCNFGWIDDNLWMIFLLKKINQFRIGLVNLWSSKLLKPFLNMISERLFITSEQYFGNPRTCIMWRRCVLSCRRQIKEQLVHEEGISPIILRGKQSTLGQFFTRWVILLSPSPPPEKTLRDTCPKRGDKCQMRGNWSFFTRWQTPPLPPPKKKVTLFWQSQGITVMVRAMVKRWSGTWGSSHLTSNT